ncbi:hypothetical protein ACIA8G_23785 [Lentzea sp. NPDC051213]|uniref:hypothetical protein n=1 Tax=Lentzea sp. NPDC051213 TaxID=3364126 RepID=UPI0037B54C2A
MSEQEIREGMLLAVWDEPPLDFDPDQLMRRAEQKKSRRRALASVGVATALIVATAVTLPGFVLRGGGDAQVGSETPSSVSTTPSSNVSEVRVGESLVKRLKVIRPDLKDVSVSFNFNQAGFKPTQSLQPARRNPNDLYGFVYFTDDIGPTALLVTTGQAVGTKDLCGGTQKVLFCREKPMNDGSVVVEAEYFEGTETIGAVSARKLAGGNTSVVISSYSHNPSNSTGFRQMIPVGVEVLTSLVTDPGITWE